MGPLDSCACPKMCCSREKSGSGEAWHHFVLGGRELTSLQALNADFACLICVFTLSVSREISIYGITLENIAPSSILLFVSLPTMTQCQPYLALIASLESNLTGNILIRGLGHDKYSRLDHTCNDVGLLHHMATCHALVYTGVDLQLSLHLCACHATWQNPPPRGASKSTYAFCFTGKSRSPSPNSIYCCSLMRLLLCFIASANYSKVASYFAYDRKISADLCFWIIYLL